MCYYASRSAANRFLMLTDRRWPIVPRVCTAGSSRESPLLGVCRA